MDAGRLDLLENGQVRSGVHRGECCGLVVLRPGIWGVAGDGSGIGQGAAGPLGHGSPQQNLAVVPGGQGSQGQGTRPGLPGAPIVQRVCAVREGRGQGVGEGHVLGIGGAQIG